MDKVVHFEVPADDMERAKAFYQTTFGWSINPWPMPDGHVYHGAITVPVDEATQQPKEMGGINGALVDRDPKVNAQPVITMGVESINASLEKIKFAGVSEVAPRVEIPGMGAYAYAKDSEGNIIGLWEDTKQA